MFGAGTACIVCPIKGFVYSDKNFDVPLDPEDPSKEAGPLARRLNQTILSIQYGETPNPWSVVL
ncbi:branched-chain-amino-acid aminotransferase [Coelomomyces lativittatus]|nr:branched-chain-amino-acid aminotransferase [Coelomomyces lativittatus]